MMNWNGNWGSGGWFVMGLMMLVLWGVVAWAIVAATRTRRSAVSPSPRELLDGRLAHGEISVAEYEALNRALRSEPEAV